MMISTKLRRGGCFALISFSCLIPSIDIAEREWNHVTPCSASVCVGKRQTEMRKRTPLMSACLSPFFLFLSAENWKTRFCIYRLRPWPGINWTVKFHPWNNGNLLPNRQARTHTSHSWNRFHITLGLNLEGEIGFLCFMFTLPISSNQNKLAEIQEMNMCISQASKCQSNFISGFLVPSAISETILDLFPQLIWSLSQQQHRAAQAERPLKSPRCTFYNRWLSRPETSALNRPYDFHFEDDRRSPIEIGQSGEEANSMGLLCAVHAGMLLFSDRINWRMMSH